MRVIIYIYIYGNYDGTNNDCHDEDGIIVSIEICEVEQPKLDGGQEMRIFEGIECGTHDDGDDKVKTNKIDGSTSGRPYDAKMGTGLYWIMDY